jgi:choline dehydrogenase
MIQLYEEYLLDSNSLSSCLLIRSSPDYDWGFKTVPQIDLNDRIVAQLRGKVLGGSLAINFMMLSHASKVEIDSWEKLGNPGWKLRANVTFLQKIWTYNAPDEALGKTLGSEIIDRSLHGSSGPIQVTVPHGSTDLDASWRPTHQALGLGAEQDPRLGATLGGYAVLKYIDKGAKRSYSASAYYAPISSRPNLSVLTNARVNRILFEDKTENGQSVAGVAFPLVERTTSSQLPQTPFFLQDPSKVLRYWNYRESDLEPF